MATINLTDALKGAYQQLFDTCDLRPERMGEIETILDHLQGGRPATRRFPPPPACPGM